MIRFLGDALVSAKLYAQACDHFENYVEQNPDESWFSVWEEALFGQQEVGWNINTIDTVMRSLKDENNQRTVDEEKMNHWDKYANAVDTFLNYNPPRLPNYYKTRLKLVRNRVAVARAQFEGGNSPTLPRTAQR